MMRIFNLRFIAVLSVIVFANTCFAKANNQKTFIFFYAGYCKHCHQMADVLVKIRKKHGIRIIANSLDGKPIAQFPDAIHNENLNRKFKIIATPTIVAVDVEKQTFEVVSIELETYPLLEAKILAQLNG
jgi:thiol-disulfide isomerase/thioredoxin